MPIFKTTPIIKNYNQPITTESEVKVLESEPISTVVSQQNPPVEKINIEKINETQIVLANQLVETQIKYPTQIIPTQIQPNLPVSANILIH